jgi:hypothetical protein
VDEAGHAAVLEQEHGIEVLVPHPGAEVQMGEE